MLLSVNQNKGQRCACCVNASNSVFVTDGEQEECREQLCNCGALPALIQLASMDDEATKLRCVVAFANLSCEYTIRGQMVRGRQSYTRHVTAVGSCFPRNTTSRHT